MDTELSKAAKMSRMEKFFLYLILLGVMTVLVSEAISFCFDFWGFEEVRNFQLIKCSSVWTVLQGINISIFGLSLIDFQVNMDVTITQLSVGGSLGSIFTCIGSLAGRPSSDFGLTVGDYAIKKLN